MIRTSLILMLLVAAGCEPPQPPVVEVEEKVLVVVPPVLSQPPAAPTPTAERIYGKKIKNVYTAKVVKIVDGDTLGIIDGENKEIRIRLDSIDTPELLKGKAPFAEEARERLEQLTFGKTVVIYHTGQHWERQVAFIFTSEGLDVNFQMVLDGFAWDAIKYSKTEDFAAAEKYARENRLGLWNTNVEPIRPSEWRDGRRE